ncbi:hypothetical protein AAG906_011304 [Vitis piasezkii]
MRPKGKIDQELPLILSVEVKISFYLLPVSDLAEDSYALAKTVRIGCMIYLETDDVEVVVGEAVAARTTNECATADGESVCCSEHATNLKDPDGFVMAAVALPADQATELLQNLSLDSQTKTLEIPKPIKKPFGNLLMG